MLPLFNNNYKNQNISWNSSSLLNYLKTKNIKKNLFDELCVELSYFPKLKTLNGLTSNKYDNIKKNVLDYFFKKNINYKKNYLFLQLHKNKKGKSGLFITNEEKILNWIFIDNNSINECTQLLLKEVSKTIKKPTLIILDKKLYEIESFNYKFKSIEICKGLYFEESVYKKYVYHSKSVSKNSYLKELENESIHIIREATAVSNKPVMLYSIGKDSSVLLHLAKKAFYPGNIPFPLLHIDTKWKFKSMYKFREHIKNELHIELITFTNGAGIRKGINPIDFTSDIHTDIMKTQALKKALNKHKFDFILAGARRDEEKSRAKERVFSIRDNNHKWNPKKQRPEVWGLFNTKLKDNTTMRVFPLSNWTEIDIWNYIKVEKIHIVDLYFSKFRPVIKKNNILLMIDDERLKLSKKNIIEIKKVRFRTLGCYPLTGAIPSNAQNVDEIIEELYNSKSSERLGRLIDNDHKHSMEIKKMEGYF